ncbi:hypothetical protein LshimejAT787_0202100 [Lyophyllum shimeji]|uniref:Uncharacterized protein n=1 Tax=Lyophyllum shimeji TaxID=47721 RepID=A0A9P3UKM2_LYOSH|nr:hypothetical protein LshimejAT787_0202100 [Lyophyllum shimeji]
MRLLVSYPITTRMTRKDASISMLATRLLSASWTPFLVPATPSISDPTNLTTFVNLGSTESASKSHGYAPATLVRICQPASHPTYGADGRLLTHYGLARSRAIWKQATVADDTLSYSLACQLAYH